MNFIFKSSKPVAFALISASFIQVFPAFAQDNASTPLEPLYSCSKITDNDARLKCFDEIVANIKQKEEKSEIVAIDRPRMQQIKKEAFGFKVPSLGKFDFVKDKKVKSEDDELNLLATKFDKGSRPKVYFDNGQIWQLVDNEEINLFKPLPIKAKIERASLGSYLLTFEGKKRGYLVHRVE